LHFICPIKQKISGKRWYFVKWISQQIELYPGSASNNSYWINVFLKKIRYLNLVKASASDVVFLWHFSFLCFNVVCSI
jgi:hypothetical protein